MTYAYQRFSRELIREDSTFRTGPEPGDRFPPFDLPTVGGGRVTLEGVAGRPFLMVLASYT